MRSEVVTMSATDANPLFGSNGDGDGTQAPLPQNLFTDPLSGLVTAGAAQPVSDDYGRLRIADPVQVDGDTVREMMQAALLAENLDQQPEQPMAIPPQSTGTSVVPGQPPLGMLGRPRPRLTRRSKARISLEEDVDEIELMRSSPRIRPSRPSSSSTGVIVALVLMIVFAILVIELVVSLSSGIAGIFS